MKVKNPFLKINIQTPKFKSIEQQQKSKHKLINHTVNHLLFIIMTMNRMQSKAELIELKMLLIYKFQSKNNIKSYFIFCIFNIKNFKNKTTS